MAHPPNATKTQHGDFPWWLVALAVIGATLALVIAANDLYSQVFSAVSRGRADHHLRDA
jgi:polar amino acid transport system permease protein